MKIKESEYCIRYSTFGFWMHWTKNETSGAHFSSVRYSADLYVVKMTAVRSEILKELAK